MLTFPYQKLLASVALVNSSSLSLLPKRVKIIQIINHIGGISFHLEAQPHPVSWNINFYDLQSLLGPNWCQLLPPPPPNQKNVFLPLTNSWLRTSLHFLIVKQWYLDKHEGENFKTKKVYSRISYLEFSFANAEVFIHQHILGRHTLDFSLGIQIKRLIKSNSEIYYLKFRWLSQNKNIE